MKTILIIGLLLPVFGCSTFNNGMAKIVHELARDTNTVHLRVTSATFGTLEFDRNAPIPKQ